MLVEYFDSLKEIAISKRNFKKSVSEYNNIISSLSDIINSCDECIDKFNQLYEEKKFLLVDPEELYNRINSLENINLLDEGKDIVKCRKRTK